MTTKEAAELLKKGRAYAQRTKFKEAMAYYNKALTLDPKSAEGWCLRASVLIETGSPKEAIADCDRALALNQNYSDAWSKKALALFNLEKFQDAVLAATRASTLNGNDAMAWYIKGVCLDELGKSDEAQEAYGKSLELEIIMDMDAERKKIRRT